MSNIIHFFEYLEYEDLNKLEIVYQEPEKGDNQTYIAYLENPVDFYLPKSEILDIYQDDFGRNIASYIINITEHSELLTFLENFDTLCIDHASDNSEKWFKKPLSSKVLIKYYNNLYTLDDEESDNIEQITVDLEIENPEMLNRIEEYNKSDTLNIVARLEGIEFFKQTFKWKIKFYDLADGIGEYDTDSENLSLDFTEAMKKEENTLEDNREEVTSTVSDREFVKTDEETKDDIAEENVSIVPEENTSNAVEENAPIAVKEEVTSAVEDKVSAVSKNDVGEENASKEAVSNADEQIVEHTNKPDLTINEIENDVKSHSENSNVDPSSEENVKNMDMVSEKFAIESDTNAKEKLSNIVEQKQIESQHSEIKSIPGDSKNNAQSFQEKSIQTNLSDSKNENTDKLTEENIENVQDNKSISHSIKMNDEVINDLADTDSIRVNTVYDRENRDDDKSKSSNIENSKIDTKTLLEIETIINDKRIEAKKYLLNAERAKKASQALSDKAALVSREVTNFEEKLRNLSHSSIL